MYTTEKPNEPAVIALEEKEDYVALKVDGWCVLAFHKCDGSIERVDHIDSNEVPFEVDSEGRAIIEDVE